jgi:large subunit ribosomal protein L6
MSRVGKKIISTDKNVDIKVSDNLVTVKGPKGSLSITVLPFVTVGLDNNIVSVSVENSKEKFQRAIWGTTRALISNMIVGVTDGFKKEVELNGVGYKLELVGQKLTAYIGFSHPVVLVVPDPIKLELNKNVLSGVSIDKQLLNNFFGNLHEMKPCDPYKQKGFKFPGRFYIKKVGKKGGKAK